jgi:hypothetical protein
MTEEEMNNASLTLRPSKVVSTDSSSSVNLEASTDSLSMYVFSALPPSPDLGVLIAPFSVRRLPEGSSTSGVGDSASGSESSEMRQQLLGGDSGVSAVLKFLPTSPRIEAVRL